MAQSSSGDSESCDLQSEENTKVLPEKNKKRRFKTRSQIEALERFYNEHKYPTEEMKEQLSHDIGLTEKQISGWFCHRRLKDKRLGLLNKEGCKNGRQDRSSGVIQDSCGSTKQGDYKLAEVESRRLCSQDFPLDPPYEYRGHYTGKFSGRDDDVDTSSDSSSPLQDRNFPQMQDPHEMAMATVVPSVKRGHGGPSGYLKVKGEVEHAAITAVKRNLGRNYHVDGPPVGIEFQPLPPGAFETPVIDNVNEHYYLSTSCLPHSTDMPGVQKQPIRSSQYEVYDPKVRPQDSYIDGDDLRDVHGPDGQIGSSRHHLKQKSSVPKHKDTSLVNMDRYYDKKSTHKVDGIGLDSVSNCHVHSYGGKASSEKTEPWLHDYDDDDVSPNIVRRRKHFESHVSNSMLKHGDAVDTEERAPPRKIPKEEEARREKRARKEYPNPVRVKMHPAKDTRVGKKVGGELAQQDYATKVACVEMPRPAHQIKRLAMEMPSSFSEDETAETSSSL